MQAKAIIDMLILSSRLYGMLGERTQVSYIITFSILFQVQGKDPSVDFTQDIIEESEDERCFDEMSDSVPPIELPPCELGRLEEISELVINSIDKLLCVGD